MRRLGLMDSFPIPFLSLSNADSPYEKLLPAQDCSATEPLERNLMNRGNFAPVLTCQFPDHGRLFTGVSIARRSSITPGDLSQSL